MAAEWPQLAARIRNTRKGSPDPAGPPFQGGWIGWLGYELGQAFGAPVMPGTTADAIDASIAHYDVLVAWDNLTDQSWLISSGQGADGLVGEQHAIARRDRWLAQIASVRGTEPRQPPDRGDDTRLLHASNFTAEEYRSATARLIEYVLAGDIFEANLSQQFTVTTSALPLDLYLAVRRRTPAALAAFLPSANRAVSSASPELFLKVDASGIVETRPIKGTRPRGHTTDTDLALGAELLASEKDRAENVMIVDLLRNDLGKACTAGSVQVEKLFEIESFANVHHLVSTVVGDLRPDLHALDLVRGAGARSAGCRRRCAWRRSCGRWHGSRNRSRRDAAARSGGRRSG